MFCYLGISTAVMVKRMGLSPLSEEAPFRLSVAGTLGVDDLSELGNRPALLPHKTRVLYLFL